MTKKEYLKYNNPEALDNQGKHVKPGDTVVFNNHHGATPYIGVVDHYTQIGTLAISYDYTGWRGNPVKCWAYRHSSKVIKIKNGNKSRV